MDYDSSARPSLGLPEMEEQHRYLYRLFDLVEDASSVTDQPQMAKLLSEIEKYVLFHIESEEHLMRAYGVPGFGTHQSDHEQFESKLVGYLDDFEAGKLNPARLKFFLIGWLSEHSKISDSQYVEYILAKRRELTGERA